MRILLLRHGITEANEKHLYCGSTDLPLSPAGRAALRRQEMPASMRKWEAPQDTSRLLPSEPLERVCIVVKTKYLAGSE